MPVWILINEVVGTYSLDGVPPFLDCINMMQLLRIIDSIGGHLWRDRWGQGRSLLATQTWSTWHKSLELLDCL
jgi:hypothetical protein